MSRTVIQVPVTADFRRAAERSARARGFSSLQDAVRLFLHKLALGVIDVTFREEEITYLSPKAEKRYAKMSEDFKKGKNIYKAKDLDDFFQQLKIR